MFRTMCPILCVHGEKHAVVITAPALPLPVVSPPRIAPRTTATIHSTRLTRPTPCLYLLHPRLLLVVVVVVVALLTLPTTTSANRDTGLVITETAITAAAAAAAAAATAAAAAAAVAAQAGGGGEEEVVGVVALLGEEGPSRCRGPHD